MVPESISVSAGLVLALTRAKDYAKQGLLLGTHAEASNAVLHGTVKLLLETPEEEQTFQDFSESLSGFNKESCMQISAEYPHPYGEPNRARYSPSQPEVIGAIGSQGVATVYREGRAIATLQGHSGEGWAIAWNQKDPLCLATGADDAVIHLWNIEKPVEPAGTLKAHTGPVQSIVWRTGHPQQLLSVGDDEYLHLWDVRVENALSGSVHAKTALNALSCHAQMDWLLAVGGSDTDVILYDIRRFDHSIGKLGAHTDAVTCIEFCPYDDRYLLSAGNDKKVLVWDLSACGKECHAEDDGPIELIFTHVGHDGIINDACWNPCAEEFPMTIASVCNEGQLQVWSISDPVWDAEEQSVDDYPVE